MSVEQERVTALATGAESLLKRYIAIHDALFAGSLWRRLFGRVDYRAYAAELGAVASGLTALRQQAIDARADEPAGAPTAAFLDGFIPYVEALTAAESHLGTICQALDRKARRSDGQTLAAYNRDVEDYKALVSRYRALGGSLNLLFEAL